jgi:hypothetical protein
MNYSDRRIIIYIARCTAAYAVIDKLRYTVINTVVYLVKYTVACLVDCAPSGIHSPK